jgi:hypothetical protein
MTYSTPVGAGSDLTGMDPGYMLESMVDPTFEPTAPFHFEDVLGHYEKGAVPGHLPMDITDTPFYSAARGEPYAYGTEGLVTPEVDEVTPELDANTRALIDFDMEQNRQTMGLDPAPWGALQERAVDPNTVTAQWGGLGRAGAIGLNALTNAGLAGLYMGQTPLAAGLGGLALGLYPSDVGVDSDIPGKDVTGGAPTWGAHHRGTPTGLRPSRGTDTGVNTTGFSMGQHGIDAQGNLVTPMSPLANPDITVANTIAEQIAETEAMLGSMGLTGATAAAAQQAMTGSSGYITPDQIAGLVAAQQEQDRAVAAASAAAAAASAASSGGDWGGEDTGVTAGPAGAPQGAHHAGSAVSKAVDRAVQNAIIDALIGAVGPGESALSETYAGLGYGGGLGEGAEGLGEGYGGFGGGWT